MVLDASLLNTQHYKVRIKGKVEQSREGVALSPTPWCSSYRKGSLRVTLDYGRQLYLLLLMRGLFRDTDILVEAPPRHRKTFSLLTFTWIVFCLCFFLLFNKRILLSTLLSQTWQFRVLFLLWRIVFVEDLIFERGKACQLAVLTFNNSPTISLVDLKCGSARELVISVTLNSVRQTTANVWWTWWERLVDLAGTNSTRPAHWTHGGVTIYMKLILLCNIFRRVL